MFYTFELKISFLYMVALFLPFVHTKTDLHLKLCLFPIEGQLVPCKMQPFHFIWALTPAICCVGFPVVQCHDRTFEVMLQGIFKNILFLISLFVGNLFCPSYIKCLNILCTSILPMVPSSPWFQLSSQWSSPHSVSSNYLQDTEKYQVSVRLTGCISASPFW